MRLNIKANLRIDARLSLLSLNQEVASAMVSSALTMTAKYVTKTQKDPF